MTKMSRGEGGNAYLLSQLAIQGDSIRRQGIEEEVDRARCCAICKAQSGGAFPVRAPNQPAESGMTIAPQGNRNCWIGSPRPALPA